MPKRFIEMHFALLNSDVSSFFKGLSLGVNSELSMLMKYLPSEVLI